MFSDERRASPVGRWNSPPWSAVLSVSVGAVAPVRAAPSPVSAGWSACWSARRKNTLTFAALTGPPLVWTLSAPIELSASSVASTCAAVALNASGAVVWPLKVSVNVPPVAFVTRTVCCSSVRWSFAGA